jgi:hypothetical protein
LIGAVQTTPTCNSFPKIFGGSSAFTYLKQIDAFNDFLAIAGETHDIGLLGLTTTSTPSIPYLALASISGGGKYYWAKALSLKTFSSFHAV